MKSDKLLQWMAWFTILFTIAFLSVITFWLVYPYRVPKYNTDPQKVEHKKIKGGQYQIIFVDLCRYEQYFPVIERAFVDGLIYQIPAYTGADNRLGCHIAKVQVYVPKTLPPNKYKLATHYSWKLNPIRTIEKTIYTEEFQVVD